MNTWISHRGALGGFAAAVIATALALSLASSAQAASTLALTSTDAAVGQPIHATANLSDSPDATGEISFEIFGPGEDCSGSALTPTPASAAVNGEGPYLSGDFTPTSPGTYHWSAHYSGDGVNDPADSVCSAVSVVGKASPGLTGNASAAIVGNAIHDEATLSGGFSPGGEVTFSVFGPGDFACSTPLKTASATVVANGAISADFVPAQAGSFRWKAVYSGDANNEPASTACGTANQTSVVSKASPTLSGTATASAIVGQTITDSATLSGSFGVGGELVFRAYGPGGSGCAATPAYEAAVDVGGAGTYSPAGFAPAPGTYRWTVAYSGNSNNAATATICGAADQSSQVKKASPTLTGVATSAVLVGQTITDNATLSGGFGATGQLVFRAYGPGDATCSTVPVYEQAVAVSGDGPYSPAGFAPLPGLYRWTVEYAGDGDNEAASSPCDTANQSSAVGTINVVLLADAAGSTVGEPAGTTATIKDGAIPAGQIAFKAFPPGDASCSGTPAFSSTVGVSGNGSYRAAFVPTRVGTYRWTVSYSGDPNHAPAAVECGKAASTVAKAKPAIAGKVPQRLTVGTSFRDTATLQGAYAAGGTVTFRIYGPVASGCAKPLFVNTVAVSGNGTVSSDPFVAQRPGRYSFVASYSGDAENQPVSEPCDSPAQVAQVAKRAPKVKPRGRLIGGRLISIGARLSGGVSPSGLVNFRLYGPGDKRCKGRPAFSGGITVSSNGSYSLAKYLATKPGVYRLEVGYSGDPRNQRYKGSCGGAQTIRVG